MSAPLEDLNRGHRPFEIKLNSGETRRFSIAGGAKRRLAVFRNDGHGVSARCSAYRSSNGDLPRIEDGTLLCAFDPESPIETRQFFVANNGYVRKLVERRTFSLGPFVVVFSADIMKGIIAGLVVAGAMKWILGL